MRGTVSSGIETEHDSRITPACAGNSAARQNLSVSIRDHPRVCGEQPHYCNIALPVIGSPPRVRGTVPARVSRVLQSRITPACAGNRHVALVQEMKSEDHPRVCGEQVVAVALVIWAAGSPPRVRGTDALPVSGLRDAGITPACAGNSWPGLCGHGRSEDHPRVCGEQQGSKKNHRR